MHMIVTKVTMNYEDIKLRIINCRNVSRARGQFTTTISSLFAAPALWPAALGQQSSKSLTFLSQPAEL